MEMKGEQEIFKKNVMAFFLAKARFVTMDGSLFSVGKMWCEVPCSKTKVANILHLAFPFCLPCDGSGYGSFIEFL
jgi:hypothetical protein